MAQFPALKTGAVAQYPFERQHVSSTRVFRFLDGTEQRIMQFRSPLRRWVIRLDLLDEAELFAVETFVAGNRGRGNSFAFTDPIDGRILPSCRLEDDTHVSQLFGPQRGRAMIVIREQR